MFFLKFSKNFCRNSDLALTQFLRLQVLRLGHSCTAEACEISLSRNGHQLFDKIPSSPINQSIFACSSLPRTNAHQLFDKVPCHPTAVSINQTISACSSFSLNNAHYLFDKIPSCPTALSINQIITACSRRNNFSEEVLEIVQQHRRSAREFDHTTLAIVLKSCCRNPRTGLQIHGLAISTGFDSDVQVCNALMNMYCKCEKFDEASFVFAAMTSPDTVSLNTLLTGFPNSKQALQFALQMRRLGFYFDGVTLTTILTLCANLFELQHGLQIHGLVCKSGFEAETFIGNALITMYARSNCLIESRKVFDRMQNLDLVSWNAMISGYAQEGNSGFEAIEIFAEMAKQGMKLDYISFAGAISACGHERKLETGKQIHCLILKTRNETHVSVSNVLISMYQKCGFMEDANRVFNTTINRNVISWTAMISLHGDRAILFFNRMRSEQINPNNVTFVASIHACSSQNLMQQGQQIHGLSVKTGFCTDRTVANSLITMYAKFESMEQSEQVFNDLDCRETISWNALISGYNQNGLYIEALQAYLSSLAESEPNQFTFGSILSAIASGSIPPIQGRRCHCRIIKLGLETDKYVAGALIDMYAKRGGIEESQQVFDEMPERSVVSWTAIIAGHAQHGNFQKVGELFKVMEEEGTLPDPVTLLAVLSACGHVGMIEEGFQYFESMSEKYGMTPEAEHCACMVDMLGRAGRLAEAEKFIERIPTGKPRLSALQSLLGACRIHGNVGMGRRVAKALIEIEPEESGSYILISNIYAEKGEWEKVAQVRKRMKERGVKKEVGCSWVDIGGDDSMHMHMDGFTSDDKSHPRADEIYRVAESLGLEMSILEMKGNLE